MSRELLTHGQMLARLRQSTRQAGGLRSWGELNDFSAAYLSQVLHGQKPPSTRLLQVLGLELVERYRELAS